jgi:hypothetical protein
MFDGRRGEIQRRICREPEDRGDDSWPELAALAIDLLHDFPGTEVFLADSEILWEVCLIDPGADVMCTFPVAEAGSGLFVGKHIFGKGGERSFSSPTPL